MGVCYHSQAIGSNNLCMNKNGTMLIIRLNIHHIASTGWYEKCAEQSITHCHITVKFALNVFNINFII